MRPKSRQRLVDARRYASRALGVLERFGEGLAQDVDACMALERAVEVMGEAMRAMSQDDPEFHAAHRDLPWRETIRLRTKHGGTIVWGSAEEATVSEVPIATRLAYLDRLHTRAGSVEPSIGQAWDLRLDYLASRSAAETPANTMVMAAPSPD